MPASAVAFSGRRMTPLCIHFATGPAFSTAADGIQLTVAAVLSSTPTVTPFIKHFMGCFPRQCWRWRPRAAPGLHHR